MMRRRSTRCWLALVVLAWIVGCAARPATQILVRIDSDMAEGTVLLRVSVRAYFEGAPGQPIVQGMPYDLVDGGYGLPGEISIVPRDPDEARRLFVEVTGSTTSGDVTQRAVVTFQRERQRLLLIYLNGLCRSQPPCMSGQTCGNDGRCRRDDQPAVTVYTPPDGSVDRPTATVDASTDVTDAAEDMVDAVVALDVADVVDATDASDAMDAGVDVPVEVSVDAGVDVSVEAALDVADEVDAPRVDVLVCPTGRGDCDSVASNGCETDLSTSRDHCGTCMMACSSTEFCDASMCADLPFPSDGSEGAFAPTTNMVLSPRVYQFTTINIPMGVTITTMGIGRLDLRATGDVVVGGVIDLSGGNGGNGITRLTCVMGANGAGGATGNPTPGADGDSFVCAGGGAGGTGEPATGGSIGCENRNGSNGGGAGGTSLARGGGGGGGGHAGGGGAQSGSSGGQTPGSLGGTSTVGGSVGRGGGGGEPMEPTYYGGAGSHSSCDGPSGCMGGGGGSIGAVAAADQAVRSTFQTGSGGGGGACQLACTPPENPGGGGGGGGGGALRIASATSITVTGELRVHGGRGGISGPRHGGEITRGNGGGGSGGVIFLSALRLVVVDPARITAHGGRGIRGGTGMCGGGDGGPGRIRLSGRVCELGGTFTLPLPPMLSNCNPAMTTPMPGAVYTRPFPM